VVGRCKKSMPGTKQKTKAVFKKYALSPSKKLGQHFLVDEKIIKKIIKKIQIKKTDAVVEIGPGLGALTKELAKKAEKVIAIEKDPKMVELLKESLKDQKRVELIKGDALKLLKKISLPRQYKVVANIPFYLTAPLIREMLENLSPLPKEIFLVVQKELAQRITAKPPKMNLLALSVQFYAMPEIIFYIKKKHFWPEPKIDSGLIKISPLPLKKIPLSLKNNFFKLIKAGFSQPRKKLVNTLSKVLKLKKERIEKELLKNNISPGKRPENLSLKDWLNLAKNIKID